MNFEKKTFQPTIKSDASVPLTQQQVNAAKRCLLGTTHFPKINRKFIDPIIPGNPRFALFSYIHYDDPNFRELLNNIKPEVSESVYKQLWDYHTNKKKGILGAAKIRGVFYTQKEADDYADELIQNVDSANSIFTCTIGVPFPLTTKGFSDSLSEVDLQNQTEHVISQNVRNKRREDQKEMETLYQREQELMADVEKNPTDDDETNYITYRVKLAHLRYAISEHANKTKECSELKDNCLKWLCEKAEKYPYLEENWKTKYLQGRKASHIPEDQEFDGFLKYMNDPIN